MGHGSTNKIFNSFGWDFCVVKNLTYLGIENMSFGFWILESPLKH